MGICNTINNGTLDNFYYLQTEHLGKVLYSLMLCSFNTPILDYKVKNVNKRECGTLNLILSIK